MEAHTFPLGGPKILESPCTTRIPGSWIEDQIIFLPFKPNAFVFVLCVFKPKIFFVFSTPNALVYPITYLSVSESVS